MSNVGLQSFNIWLCNKNLSYETLMSYNGRITSYLQFCRLMDARETEVCSHELIQEYLEYLRETNAAPSTINQTLSALGNYFEYRKEPFPKIPRVRKTLKARALLTQEELDRLFDLADSASLKVRTLVYICFYGGLTANQLVEMDVADVSSDCKSIFVRKKELEVDLDPRTQSVLFKWILHLKHKGVFIPLFMNASGQRISRIGIDHLIRTLGIRAGIVLSARLLSQSGKEFRRAPES